MLFAPDEHENSCAVCWSNNAS